MNNDWPSTEALMKMAKDDPEALENFRQREIEKLIANAPAPMQRRLRGLQFEIDCKRRLHNSPIGACISISEMMFESFNKLNDTLQGYTKPESASHARRKAKALQDAKTSRAKVLAFPEFAG